MTTTPLPCSARPNDAAAWPDTARMAALNRQLVAWASETGTEGEALFAPRLADWLRAQPYFRDHPDQVILVPSHGTPLRHSLVALVRGTGTATVALAGHFDTVATDNYRDLQPLACQPDALLAATCAALSARTRSPQEERALADLESGDFLPGRGLLDMKSGLAAGIAVLERFAADPGRQGNLILFATPDEEAESRGMRSLRDALPGLTAALGLSIRAGLNLDATSDQGTGETGRCIYTGTIGKLMPFALVIGTPSHASYPFEGQSAAEIGAEIVARIEANPALADTGSDEICPPPICLEARSLRDTYEVTSPAQVWLAFNWLYHSLTPAALMERFTAEVRTAAVAATEAFAARAAHYAGLTNAPPPPPRAAPRIIPLADLMAAAGATGGIAGAAAAADETENPLAATRAALAPLVEGMAATLTGPAIVVGFAGLHYPPTRLDPARPLDRALATALGAATGAWHAAGRARMARRPIFTGISDMSFFGQPAGPGAGIVVANTAVPRLVDTPPADALDFPVVNIGPWGREFHQSLERLYTPYAYNDLPAFLYLVATQLLGAPAPSDGSG